MIRTRRSVPVAAVAATVLMSLLGAACSSDSKRSEPSTTVAAPAGNASGSSDGATTTTIDPALSDPVGRYLISTVPEGFSLQSDEFAGTGQVGLDLAVEEDGASDARSFLESVGYVSGYRRMWGTNDLGRTLFVALDLLGDDAGATAYCARAAETMRKRGTVASAFDVAGHPEAIGVRASDGSGSASAVFAAKGRWCVEALMGGTNDIPMADQQQQAIDTFLLQFAAV